MITCVRFLLGIFILFTILSTASAHAEVHLRRTQRLSTAILIENLDPNSKQFKDICWAAIEEVAEWGVAVRAPIMCAVSQAQFEQMKRDPNKDYGTLVKMVANGNKLTLSIHSLIREEEVYPMDVPKGDFIMTDSNFYHALHAALEGSGNFDANYVAIRENAIQEAAASEILDQKMALPENRGKKPSEISVTQREFNIAYANFNRQDPDNKRYVSSVLMSSALLLLGTGNYYREHNPSIPFEDDDYTSVGESLKARLTGGAFRFDDNTQYTNIGHMYAGALHSWFARSSGMSRLWALAQTFAFSFAWESTVEYKQAFSINDQVATGVAGNIIGEAFFQMGRILQKDGGGPLKRFFAAILGGPQKLSQWLENTVRGRDILYNDHILTREEQDFWSHMAIYLGVDQRNNKSVKTVGVVSEIVNIPQMDKPEKVGKLLIEDTVASKFKAEIGRGPNLTTWKLFAKTVLAAYYYKNMHLNKDDKLAGYQLFVGPSMMVDIDNTVANHRQNGPGSDIYGVAGIIGNTIDMRLRDGDFEIHAVVDVYLDFGTIRSLAISPATGGKYPREKYVPRDGDGIQSVMANYGYYHALGWSRLAHLDFGYKAVSAGGEIGKVSLHAIDGRSRFLTKEPLNAHDSVTKKSGWVALLLNPGVRIEFGAEERIHNSYFRGTTVRASDVRAQAKLYLVLD